MAAKNHLCTKRFHTKTIYITDCEIYQSTAVTKTVIFVIIFAVRL